MPRIIDRVRSRQAAQRAASAQNASLPLPTGNRTDLVLQRLANGSQLGLLLLAIFGYFYTVLPIYQKALLDEEIAKKTLELRSVESRLSQAEALLTSREAEFNAMIKRVNDLKAAADAARRSLGHAQTEVGKLRGTVESQYLELRPRLLRDFRSLVLSQCKGNGAVTLAFAECVERKVLRSPVLAGLESADRTRLIRIVRAKSSTIDSAWAEYSSGIALRKRDAESQVKDAKTFCEQLKGTNDYKDRMKRISIDYECSVEVNRATSDQLKIQIDEMFAEDKVLEPHLSSIVKEFFAER